MNPSLGFSEAADLNRRGAGVLLHVTSLPGGRLGAEALRFVDWLADAGQRWWQLLPLGPPDEHGSPYASSSAFAAWPGLLAEPDARVTAAEVEDFVAHHGYWIGDWAEAAGPGAISDQVRFEREWSALRAYAAERGVGLIGDLPLYVAPGSVDHRARPELFQAGAVAGAPPDALSAEGQLWKNPLYDWGAHRRQGYRWWIERFRRTFELVDVTRVDHFRGFVSYWAVPEGDETAVGGRWRPGPGLELFRAVEQALGRLPLIAEDLGVITAPVYRLRDRLGLPGMAVMQWAFGGSRTNLHRVENHSERTAVYVGTHDTDTALGWWRSLPGAERAATGLDPGEPHWGLIRAAYASRAALAVVPAQDVLGLGSEARMNTPGRERGNWAWRLEADQLTSEHASRLRQLAAESARLAH